jgi:hypothetical protein
MTGILIEKNNGGPTQRVESSQTEGQVRAITDMKRSAVPIEILVEDPDGKRRLTSDFTEISKLWADKFLNSNQK